MEEYTLISESPEETFFLGKKLGENLRAGDCVALRGELGAGKTCLTQGIARGLGVPDACPVTSPTFTLVNEYAGRVMLYHLDVYRLEQMQNFGEIGYDESTYERGVLVVEWAEKIYSLLPKETLFVTLEYLAGKGRKLAFKSAFPRTDGLIRALKGGT